MKKECRSTPYLEGLPELFMLLVFHHTDRPVDFVHKLSPGQPWMDDTLYTFRPCTPQDVHSQEHHQLTELSCGFVAAL